ncbi:hypothetical protein HPB49_022057 [Dermacentor silvarum]|uniref:Uncharacterized protein n=1 Tax=Dermacentor silvarum TaxID=543639 RepID=A0ACB8DRI0_DERSI|nr:hypothetical protein HPB49_022057 [Dermacentor silvarum]
MSGSWQHSWDCRRPQEQLTAWNGWVSKLPTLSKVHLPRQVNRPQEHVVGVTELPIFADASLRAYGVAVYVCSE